MTDSHYGTTLDIYACSASGLLFCPGAGDLTHYYEALVIAALELAELYPLA
jgi:hypothetical protein